MADDLAAVVLRETDVGAARLDDAVQRQVLSGGGLDTALMEMGLIEEVRLLALLEKVHGLPSVGREDIRQIDPGAVAVFPQRLAEKHGIVPLELSGRRLSVAVAQKPDLNLLDEIGFMLSVYVRPFVTTEARLAYGLLRLYGVPLPGRIENLLGMLGEDPEAELADEREAAAIQAEQEPPAPPTAREPVSPPPEPALPEGEDAPVKETAGPRWEVEPTAAARVTAAADHAGPEIKLTPARSESAFLSGGFKARTDEDPVATEPPPEEAAATPPPPEAGPTQDATEAERAEVRARLLAEVDAEEARERARQAARREERVRWTVDDAIAELALAGDRDAMVDVVLRFARRRLSTVAMFVVHKDAFTGWDIIDPALDREAIGRVSIPARGTHVLGKLWEMRSPFLGPLETDDPLAEVLGRQPRAALLVPVMVEDKLAAVLYGDCGPRTIPPSSLAELHMVAPRLGKALRNLILRSKGQEVPTAEPEPEARIEPAAEPVGDLPVIELELDEFDDLGDEPPAAAPAEPAPAPAAGNGEAAPSGDDTEALDAALDYMSSASAGSFGRLKEGDNGAEAVASVVGVNVDIDEPAPELEIDDADIEGSEAAPDPGAERRAALEADETELEFRSVDAEAPARGPDEPPPIPKRKPKAKNRGPARKPVAPQPPASLVEEAAPSAEVSAEEAAPAAEVSVDAAPSTEVSVEEPAAAMDVVVGEAVPSDEGTPVVEPEPAAQPEVEPEPEPEVEPEAAPSVVVEEPAAPAAEVSVEAAAPEAEVTVEEAAPSAEGFVARTLSHRDPAVEPPSALSRALPAQSPGAAARESVLLATWKEWMSHDDPEMDELLAELQQPGEAGRAAINRVVGEAERIMPSLARYFPGVLHVHPFGHLDARPDVREFSDALACLERLGPDLAAPILVAEVNHEDRLHRYAAIWALSELVVPAALARLTQRVFDPEYRIALLVFEVLEAYQTQPQFPRVLERLRDLVKRGNEFERKRAIQALAYLKDRDALPLLVDLLGTRPKDISEEAHRGLVEITKQDFGTSGRRWRAWITDHKDLPRTEWLILGLAHKDADVRAGAQAELNQLTGHYFGYRFDAPRAERDAAIQEWRQWWTDEADRSALP